MRHLPLKIFPFSDEVPVFFEQLDSQRATPIHDHEFYEIAIILQGSARHSTGGVVTEASVGDTFVIPTGASHSWTGTRDLQLLNIYYRAECFISIIGASGESTSLSSLFFSSHFFENPAMRAVVNFKTNSHTLASIRNELAEIQFLPDELPILAQTFCAGCFLKILSRLASNYLTHHSLSPAKQLMHPTVYRLLEALNHQASLGEVPSMSLHADQLGMTPQYISRIFTEQVGMPPIKYFNQRRLEHAKELLSKNFHTTTEIAHRLGFSDSAHFCRAFKENFHLTPSEFRRADAAARVAQHRL